MMTFTGQILLVLGSVLILLAGAGVVRFPDVFTRANAATKAAGLGVACVLLGAGLAIGTWEAGIKLGLAAVLQFVTAPIAGHVMGRAAYRSGAPLSPLTHIDDLQREGSDANRPPGEAAGR